MNHEFNRRDFIKRASLLPLCTTGVGLGAVSAMAIEPIKRAGGSNLKTALNAYSFTGPLPQTHEDQTSGASAPIPAPSNASSKKERKKGAPKDGPRMTLFDLVDFCSKSNIDGCDLTGYFFPTYPAP